jgi:tRNA(Ile)-lysidine synthase
MKWRHHSQDPSHTSNFESVARYRRYQCFAWGALRCNVKDLFLGHQLSDQIETIIQRMIRDKAPSTAGLTGMRQANRIPSCGKIFGAHDGSETSRLSELVGASHDNYPIFRAPDDFVTSFIPVPRNEIYSGNILVCRGGMKVYRPLLSFTKARLVATCEENNVPFVVDPSNFDPKFTQRNAIRELLSDQEKLPRALRQDSILRLRDSVATLKNRCDEKVNELLNATQVRKLDLRSGKLVVILPTDIVETYSASVRDVCTYLYRLLRLVSPGGKPSRPWYTLARRAKTIFPELASADEKASDASLLPDDSFTAMDVSVRSVADLTSDRTRLLSRCPFRLDDANEQGFVPAPDWLKDVQRGWSNWTLWDGRYWIRIRTRSPDAAKHFTVRPLTRADMEKLNASDAVNLCRTRRPRRSIGTNLKNESPDHNASQQPRMTLKDALQSSAPGKLRFTLPVIVKNDETRAFPTLDIAIPPLATSGKGMRDHNDSNDDLDWEVRYKDISETIGQMRLAEDTDPSKAFGDGSNIDLSMLLDGKDSKVDGTQRNSSKQRDNHDILYSPIELNRPQNVLTSYSALDTLRQHR